jgi:hypothetical protein
MITSFSVFQGHLRDLTMDIKQWQVTRMRQSTNK